MCTMGAIIHGIKVVHRCKASAVFQTKPVISLKKIMKGKKGGRKKKRPVSTSDAKASKSTKM